MRYYTKIITLSLAALLLGACNQNAEDPKTVADKYWQQLQSGNATEAAKLTTLNSRPLLSQHSERINTNTQLHNGEAKTIVNTTITTINPEDNSSNSISFETVLVLEQGKWKIDVTQSPIPPAAVVKDEELEQIAEELSESLKENMETMDEAVNHGMQLLDEALQEGSKEMSKSLLHLMDEINKTMQESVEEMKKRRQQQLQEQQKQQRSKPDPDKGEGII